MKRFQFHSFIPYSISLRYDRNCLRMLSSLPVLQSTLRSVISSPSESVSKLENLYAKLFGSQAVDNKHHPNFAVQLIASENAVLSVSRSLFANLKMLCTSPPPNMTLQRTSSRSLAQILDLESAACAGRITKDSPLPFGVLYIVYDCVNDFQKHI